MAMAVASPAAAASSQALQVAPAHASVKQPIALRGSQSSVSADDASPSVLAGAVGAVAMVATAGLALRGARHRQLRAAVRPGKRLVSLLQRRAVEASPEEFKTALDLIAEEEAMLAAQGEKEQLVSFDVDTEEIPEETEPPVVLEVKQDVVVLRSGIEVPSTTKAGEVIEFEMGATGVLMCWKESIGVIYLEKGEVFPGETAAAKGFGMQTAASSLFRGRILDPRGKGLDDRPAPPVPSKLRATFAPYKDMNERSNRYRPLFTGVQGVDFTVPIGRGQTMLFQGSDPTKDKSELWPDLMATDNRATMAEGTESMVCNIAVCPTLEEAEALRAKLEARGVWDQCTIIVPDTTMPGAQTVAINAAMALGEQIAEEGGDSAVITEVEPMHRVWMVLSDAAGEERRAKGVMETDEAWVDMEGTIVKESISERRKFWFAFISRATNAIEGGSITLLPWVWERQSGKVVRQQKAYQMKLEEIRSIPRISEETREKLLKKVEDDAARDGVPLDDELEANDHDESRGVPNFEIEELKSISDGHVLLHPVESGNHEWVVDPYKSLPRLGTDALHTALIAVDAHKLRLRMMQGRDRANMLNDTLGASDLIGVKDQLELRHVEATLRQTPGKLRTVLEETAWLTLANSPNCRKLVGAECDMADLEGLVDRLLTSEAGSKATDAVKKYGTLYNEHADALKAEVDSWESVAA
eukprot:TRINITY_DN111567_c0_g1_i1.p1 TRINITY_DN111567_c0_g1~~TRINITY_DN111567_c0_g1_i1.p1  ORF type:complete len:699 (+),score=163.76 TRINITY_DN111567_c0_g1_i1:80-2176(+)